MLNYINKITVFIAILSMLLITGCKENDKNLTVSDNKKSVELSINNGDVFDDGIIEDIESEETGLTAKSIENDNKKTTNGVINITTSAITTEEAITKWYRKNIKVIGKEITHSFSSDNERDNVTITTSVQGVIVTLKIGAEKNSPDSIIETPFFEKRVRSAEFFKNGDKWELSKISPVEIKSDKLASEEIKINRVDFYYEGETIPVFSVVMPETGKMTDAIVTKDTFNKFQKNKKIKVTATVEGNVNVWSHFGRNNIDMDGIKDGRFRKLMTMTVVNEQKKLYTIDFSAKIELKRHSKVGHIKIDAIDKETILNNGEYKAYGWRIPYKVIN